MYQSSALQTSDEPYPYPFLLLCRGRILLQCSGRPGTRYAAREGLDAELVIWSQPLQCRDYRHGPRLASSCFSLNDLIVGFFQTESGSEVLTQIPQSSRCPRVSSLEIVALQDSTLQDHSLPS